MKIIHLPILFKLIPCDAIMIYPFVFHKEKEIDQVTLNHERIHFDQVKKYGALKFYFFYIKEYIYLRIKGFSHSDSYYNISYEREAYKNQNNLDYVV